MRYIAGLLFVLLLAVQFIRPEIQHPPVTADLAAPEAVKNILKRACYDCHSNETRLRWYDQVAPVYWQVTKDVREGRKGMNFSEFGQLPAGQQQGKLWESVNQIIAGAMPLPAYTRMHPEARITEKELVLLKQYVVSLATDKSGDSAQAKRAAEQFEQWQKKVSVPENLPVALNGVAFIPDYKNWEAISSTERFDNGTMRVIFGNAVAAKAIDENQMNPWPDGTVFAKADWAQQAGGDGIIRTGEFIQVEYMIKDAKKYASTAGWGWARFKTAQLIPYGKTALFTSECVACHQPLRDQDFVFTSPFKN